MRNFAHRTIFTNIVIWFIPFSSISFPSFGAAFCTATILTFPEFMNELAIHNKKRNEELGVNETWKGQFTIRCPVRK